MNALALNAYEIKEIQDTITEQLKVRNEKLGNMEKSTLKVESSLDNMERLLSKMMDSI